MRAFLGLGANIGNREANLRLALRWLARECTVLAVSSLYRSGAVVSEGAPPGPDYLNAACEIETALGPEELLRFVKGDRVRGRPPPGRALGPARDRHRHPLLRRCRHRHAGADGAAPAPRRTQLRDRPARGARPDAMHPVLRKTAGELAEDVDFAGSNTCRAGLGDRSAAEARRSALRGSAGYSRAFSGRGRPPPFPPLRRRAFATVL